MDMYLVLGVEKQSVMSLSSSVSSAVKLYSVEIQELCSRLIMQTM